MALESGTTLAELSKVDPPASDLLSQADDHLRLVKQVLKDQFPGVLGDGYAIAITTNEEELNYVTGVTAPIQGQITANAAAIALVDAILPPGTRMVFHQAACPVGWTQDVTVDNRLARVSGTTGATEGGTDDPFSVVHNHSTGSHVLTEGEMPSHNHNDGLAHQFGFPSYYGAVTLIDLSVGVRDAASGTQNRSALTSSTGGGAAHDHGATGNAAHEPLYTDFIVCVRD